MPFQLEVSESQLSLKDTMNWLLGLERWKEAC